MATKTLRPAAFRLEAQRRLIDTFELMHLLGLRSRQGVWDRVRAGTLPQPVFTKDRALSLWDRDEAVG
jgi:predicted DNA-binding transcriptional regulator AlpA